METKEKIKVTTLDELTPLIGKKVIVKGKEIGLFLTESGTFTRFTMFVRINKVHCQRNSEW